MCEKSSCRERKGKWLKPLKLSKWERRLPDSKTYWNGVISEIERKNQKVKKSYPIFFLPFKSYPSNKIEHSNDFKLNISPPTPKLKISKSFSTFDIKSSDLENHKFNDFEKNFAINEPRKLQKNKVSSKNYFSRHASSKLLKKKKISCFKHDKIFPIKSNISEIEKVVQKKKAPKFSKASLMPSFVEPVSTDDSLSTSNESLQSSNDMEIDDTNTNKRRNEPNFQFISSRPSFKELTLLDDDDSKVLTYDFEKNPSLDEKNKTVEDSETVADVGKKYLVKILNFLRKKKRKKSKNQSKKLPSNTNMPIEFRELTGNKFKSNATELHSMTIRTSSRSVSRSSFAFKENEETTIVPFISARIPEAKMFPRVYYDKCHACLFKPFESETNLENVLNYNPVDSENDSLSSEDLNYMVVKKFMNLSKIKDNQNDNKKVKMSDNIKEDSNNHLKIPKFDLNFLTPQKTNVTISQDPKTLLFSTEQLQKQQQRKRNESISDRSKTTSSLSSDSDTNRILEDKLPRSKYMAPCHAPVQWRKSLEPLKALRTKKATSIRARTAALLTKPSEFSDSDNNDHKNGDDSGKAKIDEMTIEKKNKVKKKKKPLMRGKTVIEKKVTTIDDTEMTDAKPIKVLKKSKTIFDLRKTDSNSSSSEESDKVEDDDEGKKGPSANNEKLEPLSDLILMHYADSPSPPPVMSSEDVMSVIKECLKENNFEPNVLFDRLAKEFEKKIVELRNNVDDNDEDTLKSLNLGLNLFRALIDSKKYLKSSLSSSNPKLSHKQFSNMSPDQLKLLPTESREMVVDILGIPRHYLDEETSKSKISSSMNLNKNDEKTVESLDMIVNPPTSLESSTNYYLEEHGNPYALFLKKPRRKVVTWRPLNEKDLKGYDPEATLEKRAARRLDKICREFCEWSKQLDDEKEIIDVETLKDMFEINFSAEVCKSMKVIIKEMPTVPLLVTKVRHCKEASELEATRKQINKDLSVEKQRKKIVAFGRVLPKDLRFIPPQTKVYEKWLKCDLTLDDLETMDIVWDGIMHLDSVQKFIKFLKSSPQASSHNLLANISSRNTTVKKTLNVSHE